MARQVEVRDRWIDLCDRRLKVATLHRAIDVLRGDGLISIADVGALELEAVRIATGLDLTALVQRRRQLVEMLAAEKNRRALARRPVARRLAVHIAWLEREILAAEADIATRIRQPQHLRLRALRLQQER